MRARPLLTHTYMDACMHTHTWHIHAVAGMHTHILTHTCMDVCTYTHTPLLLVQVVLLHLNLLLLYFVIVNLHA